MGQLIWLTHYDFILGELKMFEGDCWISISSSTDGSLIHKVGEVSTRETWRSSCQNVNINFCWESMNKDRYNFYHFLNMLRSTTTTTTTTTTSLFVLNTLPFYNWIYLVLKTVQSTGYMKKPVTVIKSCIHQ